jgi:hypothetical protein
MFSLFRRTKRGTIDDTVDDTVDAETHRKWLAVSNSVTALLAMQQALLPSDFALVVDGDINKHALG